MNRRGIAVTALFFAAVSGICIWMVCATFSSEADLELETGGKGCFAPDTAAAIEEAVRPARLSCESFCLELDYRGGLRALDSRLLVEKETSQTFFSLSWADGVLRLDRGKKAEKGYQKPSHPFYEEEFSLVYRRLGNLPWEKLPELAPIARDDYYRLVAEHLDAADLTPYLGEDTPVFWVSPTGGVSPVERSFCPVGEFVPIFCHSMRCNYDDDKAPTYTPTLRALMLVEL